MKHLNSKVLFITLLASGGVAALLGIAQIWFDFLGWDDFIKAMVTIVIVGSLAGFLMAIDYDIPASKDKILLGIIVLLSIVMGVLVIAQLWWLAMAWGDFAKIFGTVLIIFVLVSFIGAIKEDFGTNKKMKDENYLD